jgi:hypothetical protein
MRICTKSKAAKLLKVSRATIYAMIERGELVPNEWGYVDLDQLPPGKDFSKPGRKRKEENMEGMGNAGIDSERILFDQEHMSDAEIRSFVKGLAEASMAPVKDELLKIVEGIQTAAVGLEKLTESRQDHYIRLLEESLRSQICSHCNRRMLGPEESALPQI